MAGHVEPQHIPVKVYRGAGRLTVAAPMPGLEPQDITVEVHGDGRLVLSGELRGTLKDDKRVLADEWNPGPYRREIDLADAVDGEMANVTYNNGVLVVALPIAEQTRAATLTLQRVGPAHGERSGNVGHPVRPQTTEEHQRARSALRAEHGG